VPRPLKTSSRFTLVMFEVIENPPLCMVWTGFG
jgi:hypothetical protein